MGGADTRTTRLLDGRYRLVERLGLGGMSEVWRGYDEVLGRQVAVKVLAPTLASDRAFRHRIRTEAQAAARLCHPHITNVYDYGEASGADDTTIPFVVMELIDGEAMSARLRHGAALPWRQAVTACAEVASALAVAHARGIVHRDVTPSNVMLTAAGAKVVDFGISALVGENDVGPDGALLGTPAYLAPERLDAGVVSPATDVYALGVLLYRSLTGRLPWRAATTTQMLKAHRFADPEPMPPVAGVPDEVVELCRRCLSKRPEDRPSSAAIARTLAAAVDLVVFLPGPARPGPGAAEAPAPDQLSTASTTILPWSAHQHGLPRTRARAPAGITMPARRRAEAVLVAAALLAIAGLIWAGASRTPGDVPGDGAPAGQPLALGLGPASVQCQVEYELRRDTGRGFSAVMTVTNTGRRAIDGWKLTFAFPGDQRVARGAGAVWQQSGRDVTARPGAGGERLAPDRPVRLALTGRYERANPLPVVFHLNDSACQAVVSGVSGGEAAGATAAGDAAGSQSSGSSSGSSSSGNGNSGSNGSGNSGNGNGNSGNGNGNSGKGNGQGKDKVASKG